MSLWTVQVSVCGWVRVSECVAGASECVECASECVWGVRVSVCGECE